MPTYVTLFKWTEQGAKDVKNAPARFETAKKLTESRGGKVVGLYVTMGEYDIVAVTEGPERRGGFCHRPLHRLPGQREDHDDEGVHRE